MDAQTQHIVKALMQGRASADDHPYYRLRDKKLYYVDRLVVPETRAWGVVSILHNLYHAGIHKTQALVSKHCLAKGVLNVCSQVVQQCQACQACKPRNAAAAGSYEP